METFLAVSTTSDTVNIKFLDFTGQVDHNYLKKVFSDILENKPKEVIIDLEMVDILGSLVISKILSFKNKTTQEPIAVKIINVKPKLLEIFRQLNLDSLFGLA
ncbi:MAG: STAS domain-containing protein [Leptospiraceae bacterium]|nr:STAS domain-containing protein [Leptospiraceae bacterium]MCK6381990.1 STAS domain-containing protein [Leptospiraceae bacterium]NUM42258.1 STAS domain-containing protein [Leptospiraceae bacterium]